MINIIFFGTHQFAERILQGLIANPEIEVIKVITQPDRPIGRKQEMQKTPTKILAEKYNIKVEQPESLKNFDIGYSNLNVDLNIVAQYGLIIQEKIINAPKYGTINVHTSLLPKYRGASPIQQALINGEKETGVTIMQMDKGLDTGPIILQKKTNIDPHDTYPTLEKKLAELGSLALNEALPKFISQELKPVPQNNEQTTFCKQLSREQGKIDWQKTNSEIYNLYRGLFPWPGIWTIWNNKRLKLISISLSEKNIPPGKVEVLDNKIFIGTNSKSIEVLELQIEGKKIMKAKEFVNGYREFDGIVI